MNRRRFVLTGVGGAAAMVAVGAGLVEGRVLPGRDAINRRLGGCGVGLDPPTGPVGRRVDGSFVSAARTTNVAYSVLYPPGAADSAALPVCLALHGRGGDHRWPIDVLHLDAFFGAASSQSPTRFAIATVDGGDTVNWHRRASGDDPPRMIVDELLPLLRDRGLLTDSIGLWGWSLGGAGALLMASMLGRDRVRAVVASSPALWTTYRAAADGTYDGADDFAANQVISRAPSLAGIPSRIDCGDLDPFADAVSDFRHRLTPEGTQPTEHAARAEPAGGITPGCHDASYWSRQVPDQLRFLAANLRA